VIHLLIKAGVLVSSVAAGLLALSPLAFAGDYGLGGDHDGHGGHSHGGGHHGDHDGDHDGDHGDHDGDHGDHDGDGGHNENASCSQSNGARDERSGGGGGLINISDINAQVPLQLCNNSILEGTLGILAGNQRNNDDH
jgi:hypothetical protein